MEEAASPARLRLAELICALSLATDLGLGQPMAHGLRTGLVALRLGRALNLDDRELADTYYTTLLRFVGCTADSHDLFAVAAGEDVAFRQLMVTVGGGSPDDIAPDLARFMIAAGVQGDIPQQAREALESPKGLGAHLSAVHCEVATMLASRLGLGRAVCDALARAFERWDGKGFPSGLAGATIPVPVRVATAARDIEVLTRLRGVNETRTIFRDRRDRTYDPDLVDAFLDNQAMVLEVIDDRHVWDEVLDSEPCEPAWVPPDRLDHALTAFADFADAKMPFTLGHSRGVADLGAAAASHLGLSSEDVTSVRRAALVHDIGRSGIANAIWERNGPLSIDQWEHVRLHAYYTERVLAQCAGLRAIGTLAAAHHERLDGSGYCRGNRAADQDTRARVLAAADVCQAMSQARPHRTARTLDDIVRLLRDEVSSGRLDAQVVEAVLAAAGAPSRPTTAARPGNLTNRELEVLRLMARGCSNKEMAASLGITAKTAGHHVQHIYDKIGVSTRAAAAVFAVEHQLI